MNKLKLFSIIIFVLLLGSHISYAQFKPEMLSISGLIGGYSFEGNQPIESGPIIGLGLGYHFDEKISTELMFNYGNFDCFFCNPINGCCMEGDTNAKILHIDALYHLLPEEKFIPYLAAGIGYISFDEDRLNDTSASLINYGIGFNYFLSERLTLRGDIRHLHTFSESHDNLSYLLGLTYLFGGKDKSQKLIDSDGDLVYDIYDQCPNTPIGVKVDEKGCPLDSDKDGVPDFIDKCPDTPYGTIVDKWGCQIINDSDGDGVKDNKDKCPNTPRGVKVDRIGCPLLIDSDLDGVTDNLDRCPNTPKGADVNIEGCWIIENLHFDIDKFDIKSKYYPNLDKIVRILIENPGLRVEIQGHTDNIGGSNYNDVLSEKRAEAIMNYLIEKGINPERLTAIGYGFSRPIAPNNTEKGQSINRRVQFRSINY